MVHQTQAIVSQNPHQLLTQITVQTGGEWMMITGMKVDWGLSLFLIFLILWWWRKGIILKKIQFAKI